MSGTVFIATQSEGITRAAQAGGQWRVESQLAGVSVNCLATDPHNPDIVFAGTTAQGLLRSADRGQTWQLCGLAGQHVKAVAVSSAQPGTVFAGTKPPALFRSGDGGLSWEEIGGFRKVRSWWWRSPAEPDLGAYIQGIALSPTEPDVILVGIEAGAVLRTVDGGHTWQGHRPGSIRDCHSITFHATQADWVYEAGGTGGGAAYSRDSGQTWKQPQAGLDRHYGWAVASDPAQPEVWYVSASNMSWNPPIPSAHIDGRANAYIFRSVGGAAWQKLSGGLPQPLNYMAYALLTDPAAPGHLYAGLSNGQVWHSADHGDAWAQLPFNLTGIHRVLIRL